MMLKKVIASTLAALQIWMLAAVAYAQTPTAEELFQQQVSDNKAAASEVLSGAVQIGPSYDETTGVYSSAYTDGNGNDVDFSFSGACIFQPGYDGTDSADCGDGGANDPSSFEALYDDDAAAVAAGLAEQDALLNSDTIQGTAYRTLLDNAQNPSPPMDGDPIWTSTEYTLSNASLVSGFDGCVENQTIEEDGTTAEHVPLYETCERISQPITRCEIFHDYQLVEMGSNECPVRPIGYDNFEPIYCSESCPQGRGFYFDNPTYPGVYDVLWYATPVNNPCIECRSKPFQVIYCSATDIGANNGAGWYWQDERTGFCGTFEGADINWCQGNGGNAWYEIIDNGWTPTECLDVAIANEQGGVCEIQATCLDLPAWAPTDDECVTVDGRTLCGTDMPPSPRSDVNPFCKHAEISDTCFITAGTGECYYDAQNNYICPESDQLENNIDGCSALADNPACAYVSTECVDGSDIGGICRMNVDTYDCGYDVDTPNYVVNNELDCGTEIRCMGEECVETTETQSTAFKDVVVATSVIKSIQTDNDCTGDPTGCTVFDGAPLECNKAVGGLQDCCFSAGMTTVLDYIKLMEGSYRITEAMGYDVGGQIAEAYGGSALEGAWTELTDPAVDAWASIQEGWTTATDSILGTADAAATAGTEVAVEAGQEVASTTLGAALDNMKQKALEAGYEAVNAVFPDAANLLFDVADDGAVALNETVANIMGGIMMVYTIYTVTTIIVQLAFPCEEEAFELAAKRNLLACHRVGRYCSSDILGICIETQDAHCCYNSPLSRILSEQIKMQIGSFGTPKNPDCSGIAIGDLESVDWSRVDLSEWVALLTQAGQMPSPGDMNITSLTGEGSNADFTDEVDRLNSAERTTERQSTFDYNTLINDISNGLWLSVPNDPVPGG